MDEPGEALASQAEARLKELLDKQLATSLERPVQVDFTTPCRNLEEVGHGAAGLSTLAEFRQQEALHKRVDDGTLQGESLRKDAAPVGNGIDESTSHGESTTETSHGGSAKEPMIVRKRKHFASERTHIFRSAAEEQMVAKNREAKEEQPSQAEPPGRHFVQLEASLLHQRQRLRGIAHLAFTGSGCRKPFAAEVERVLHQIGQTPMDSARASVDEQKSRQVVDVFAERAPPVLGMTAFLRDFRQEEAAEQPETLLGAQAPLPAQEVQQPATSEPGGTRATVPPVSEADIRAARLSVEEIRKLSGGKFAKYEAGAPSQTLYLKNIAPGVTEADLVALFMQFQGQGVQLIFRLMQHGRMKGQAFITFPDIEAAGEALSLCNGYILKGKPLVISYGRQSSCK